MAWKDSLLDASFRGIKFDVLSTRDSLQWATVEHAYPYRDGADIEDLGQGPRRISVEAVFFGADYETRLQAFLKELKKDASGELVHPVFGTLTVQLYDYDIGHEADNVDQAKVTLQFGETLSQTSFFGRQIAGQKAAAAGILGSTLRGLSGNVFANTIAAIGGNIRRISALRLAASGMLNGLLTQISGVTLSGQDVIGFPRSFLTDIGAIGAGIVGLYPFNSGASSTSTTSTTTTPVPQPASPSQVSDFNQATAKLTAPMTMPSSYVGAKSQTDIRQTAAHVNTELTLAVVDAAVIVLTQEAATPTLTPAQIEQITAAARTQIQTRINDFRSVYGLETSRTLTEPLKDIALALQDAAAAVIEMSPPLTSRTVEAPANLHLLAFRWYGDYSRADELLRLNPAVSMPNFVGRGAVLNAFAR